MCPIVRYMRTAKIATEAMSRRFIFSAVSLLLLFLVFLNNSGFIRLLIGWRGGESRFFYSRNYLLPELRSVLFALHYKCLREQIYLRVRDSFDAF